MTIYALTNNSTLHCRCDSGMLWLIDEKTGLEALSSPTKPGSKHTVLWALAFTQALLRL